MIEFSLFLNSRGRLNDLINLLNSIVKTTHDISQIELLINFDIDDEESCEVVQDLLKQYPFVRIFLINRPTNLHVAINSLASQSVGNFLFVLNDDILFLTPVWDQIILEEAESIKGDIMYLGTQDTSMDKNGNYSSFPILTRKAYEALGFFMSTNFVGLGGDVHLYRIFEAVNRVKRVPIMLDHTRHNEYSKVVNPDKTAYEMRQATYIDNVDPYTIDISKDVKKLEDKINEKSLIYTR